MRKKNNGKMMRRRALLGISILLLVLTFAVFHYIYGRGIVVAVDPGHGGSDYGAVGIVDEVDINENTARHLVALLKKDGNYTPVLTRSYGESAGLASRNRRAAWGLADLFLSIHANSSDSGNGRGFEAYPAPPGLANHEASLAFAHAVVAEISATGTVIRGNDGIRFLYYNDNGEKIIKESNDTTVYDYGTLAVLSGKEIPAVLVEQCFVNHAADIDLLGDEDGCERAAIAYYRAICAYFGTEPLL